MEAKSKNIINENDQGANLTSEKKGAVMGTNGMTREKQNKKMRELLEKLGIDPNKTIEEVNFDKNNLPPKP